MTFTARQSLIRSAQECPRRAWHEIQMGDDATTGYSEARADLGTVGHAVFAEILRTLHRQGERQLPTEEAMTIAREVMAGLPIILPAAELEELRMLVLQFATSYEWDASRLLAVEKRLSAEIACPDGQTRILTGQPDALFAGSATSLILVDLKTGWPSTRKPREDQGNPDGVITGKEYLSSVGLVQLHVYGLLVLRNYPAAERATLFEAHVRTGDKRKATMERHKLEHVEAEVAIQLQQLDQGVREGEDSPVWRARPGKWCAKACPVARSCPVPAEQRGMGAIETADDADREAARYVVVDALRGQLRDGLRTHFEATGHAAEIGDGRAIRWDGGKGSAFEIVPVNGNRQEERP